jgi:predicted RNA-binding Zn-ribbon protein involved in translation (DUF1610 family)
VSIFTLDCVDRALGLTPVQTRTLTRLAFRRPTTWQWICWGIVPLGSFVAVILVAALVVEPLLTWLGIGGPVGARFVFWALLPVAVIVYRRVACIMRRPYLSAALPLLRMETCLGCGYSLIGQADKRRPCPECGVVPASLICPECGRWLRGLSDNVKHCPECGAAREPSAGMHHGDHGGHGASKS